MWFITIYGASCIYKEKRDIAKTREWWTKAAAQGEKNAIKNLNFLDQTGNQ